MSQKSSVNPGTGQRTAALERAYLEHKGRLLTLAAAIIGGRAAAEDIVHDVFANLAAGDHDPAGNGIAAFLTVCARNAAISVLRMRKVATDHAGQIAIRKDAAGADPSLAAERAEEAEKAIGLMAELPAEERESLALRIWGEMPFEEVAKLQGVSKATAYGRCRAALAKLRSRMT